MNGRRNFRTELGIPIENEEPRSRIKRERLPQLLNNPKARRMPCDVAVQDTPAIMANDDYADFGQVTCPFPLFCAEFLALLTSSFGIILRSSRTSQQIQETEETNAGKFFASSSTSSRQPLESQSPDVCHFAVGRQLCRHGKLSLLDRLGHWLRRTGRAVTHLDERLVGLLSNTDSEFRGA